MQEDEPQPTGAPTRCGYVLVAGLPNAGKSTLTNALVGERLSIVAPKAQTTWQRVLGIRTEPQVQMIFLDTPGVLAPKSLFQRSMLEEVRGAREDADVALCLVDGARPPVGERRHRIIEFFGEIKCPKIILVNKIDASTYGDSVRASWAGSVGVQALEISALKGAGLEPVLDFVRQALPEGPFLFPEDDVAQAPVRFFVQELIRESLFSGFQQEIPYATAVSIDAFREGEDPVYIGATLHVEEKSQKGIVIGKKGAAIRRLGGDAREKIETFLERPVYLDLWVKVAEKWRRDPKRLRGFGYEVPGGSDQ